MDSNQTPKRRRARKPDGSFKGDAGLNEAWEATPIERVITDKSVDYSVKQQVSGPSAPTAGKYGKKDAIRPTFGKVTTTFN
jgi:hypothetical protein